MEVKFVEGLFEHVELQYIYLSLSRSLNEAALPQLPRQTLEMPFIK